MVKNLRPLVDKIDSTAWLNAVRNQAGNEYQTRIPEATQANLTQTISQLWSPQNIGQRNLMVDALVNQLSLVKFVLNSWENPLARFKMGMLEEGNTIEEVMVGLLQAVDYDADRDELEKEIFGDAPIETQSSFHVRNRKDRYKFTVNTPNLRSALLGNQLGSFLGGVMAAPQKSDQWDEYLLMSRLFREFDTAEAYFNVNVPDVSAQSSDGAASRFLLRRLREYSNVLPFISRMYNPAGMPVSASPDELVLFTTATADAAMDVEALAAAFNITKAEFGSRKIVMPTDNFGIDGVQAILTTDKFFVVADNLITTTSQFNPAKMSTNYWLHHWQTISASRFAPLVMFNSNRPSTTISTVATPVTSVGAFTIKDAAGNAVSGKLTRGMLYDIAVAAITTPAGGANDAVVLTVTGANSKFTRIVNNGDIFIGPDEDADNITITATSVDNNAISNTVTLQIVGTLIYPWPDPEVLQDTNLDGIEEATPEVPAFSHNIITIPSTRGVQYKNGATNLVNGAQITVAVGTPVTITAVARSASFVLAAGAPASWTYTAS